MTKHGKALLILLGVSAIQFQAQADESLFGYIKGAETLPEGAMELSQSATLRRDKGTGDYDAWNLGTEFEYGVTDRFTAAGEIKLQAIDTEGLIIDGYLPKAEDYGPRFSGAEIALKYNFLSPARDDIGLSGYWSLEYLTLDPHSGQDKKTVSTELMLLLQKYFMEGQVVWAGNAGFEATYAKRDPIANLPAGFDWPTDPEMEIELKAGTALSYRVAPKWYAGIEALYETEFETEVGQERWSIFAGPTLHYGSKDWWATLTWFHQIEGGGETYPGQSDSDLHLVEKTEDEIRFKVGLNF